MRRPILAMLLTALVLGGSQGTASALTVPFTEDFASNVAGWRDNASNALTFAATGGPDGGSYASGQFNYFGFSSGFGGGPVTFRGQQSANASGLAFVGNWVAGGVTQVSAWVRQNTAENLTLFMRIATSANFPGAVFDSSTVIAPNTWTQVVFDLATSPCTPETGTCASALASVGNVQFGTSAPAALVALNQAFTLDIDKIAIVPEPGTLLLLGAGVAGLAAAGRRRS